MRKSLSSKRKIAIGTLFILLPIAGLLLTGLSLNSNILDLVPDSSHSRETDKAIRHFTENISSNAFFLIKSSREAKAFEAAKDLEEKLARSELFKEVFGQRSNSEFKQWYELYFPHRFHFLSPESRQLLSNGENKKFLKDRIKKLYSTQSSLYSSNLEKDPLMLFGDFIQTLPSPGSFSLKNGYLFKQNKELKLILISAQFKDSVFSNSVQKGFRNVLDRFKQENPDVTLLQLGFFPYAERARSEAEWEISFIGTGSIIGIIILFLFVFKSASQLLLTLTTIAGAISFGAFTTQLIFGKIHIITIVFGATLTGVCVDYAFHWFSHLKFGKVHETAKVKKGIFWGAATSLTAYSALFISGFPGLKQIAVFSSSGIIFSLIFTLLLFPAFKPGEIQGKTVFRGISPSLLNKSLSIAILCLVLLISAAGLLFAKSNDDIRILQNRPEDLQNQEKEFRSYLSPFDSSRFILVTAQNNEELISKEADIVKNLKSKNLVENTLSISSMLPPQILQQGDFLLLSQLTNSNDFSAYCKELGFEDSIISNTRIMLKESQILKLSKLLKNPAASQVKNLYVKDKKPASIILLQNIKNNQDLSSSLPEGSFFIDKVKDTSEVLGGFRHKSFILTSLAYIIILIALCFIFGPAKGLMVIMPPFLAVLIACGLWSLFGGSFNLFNILALILILGIGIDYSIFYAFSGNNPATNTAISLSTISTLLAFGLLSLSSTPALSSFGVTLTLGIIFCYLLAPIAVYGQNKTKPVKSHSYKS